jgi:hypothetical protein
MGSNLLQTTLSSGNPVLGNPGGTEGLGTLQQGYLENSNVDVVTDVCADGAGAAGLRIELEGDQGGRRYVFAGQ